MSDVSRAEWAVHRRAGLACAAAADAGVPGPFHAWDQAGLLAVLASDPALSFLCTVSGVTGETLSAVIELAAAPVWPDGGPTLIGSAELGAAQEAAMLAAGLVRVVDRGLAVRRLGASTDGRSADDDVVEVGAEHTGFARVLLAGYEVDGTVAAFIAAEHRLPAVRRFLAVDREVPIAAAGMTIHGDVAVLGGASTLRACRGQGAQSRLLQHRVHIAADAGCTLAVATVVPDSVSAANLRRAGFDVHRRSAWKRA